jgi:steroid 5-alpha reductase family enzyme
LGLKAAGVTALALFFIFMVICWGACGWRPLKRRDLSKGGDVRWQKIRSVAWK